MRRSASGESTTIVVGLDGGPTTDPSQARTGTGRRGPSGRCTPGSGASATEPGGAATVGASWVRGGNVVVMAHLRVGIYRARSPGSTTCEVDNPTLNF